MLLTTRGPRGEGAATGRDFTRRSWSLVVMTGGVLAAVFFALPAGGLAQALLIGTAALAAVGLLTWRLGREGLLVTRPWAFLLAGTGLYAVATPFWALMPLVTGRDLPFPSVLDALYFASYGLSAAFLTILIHRRYRYSEDALRGAMVALIDAGLFALAAIAILWPMLIAPNLADPETIGLEQSVAVGYPLLTAVLVGLVARLAIGGRQHAPAEWLLLAWVVGELTGDTFYGYLSASGAFFYGHPISVTWLVSYVALGALALHPGLVRLPEGDGRLSLKGWRLAMPLGAVLVPGVMALIGDSLLLDVVALVALVLAIARFWLLSGDLAEQRRLAGELAALSRRFEHQSLHDPLTGLANRSLFTEQLQSAWAAHERHGRGLAVLMVDLDGFKTINDQHGHHTGDQVLTEVAERLQRCIRASDTLARLGGDEFALVLPETDLPEARAIAERIQELLAAPVVVDGQPHTVAASIGIARSSSRPTSPDILLREADTAMYAAKAAGKGRAEAYRPGLEHESDVVLSNADAMEAIAWATYMRALRSEIAGRKQSGEIPLRSRAPESVHRTLEQVLRAIDLLDPDATSTTLVLGGGPALEEFVYHQTAVQHWADALVARGELTARRPAEADRFWRQIEWRVVPPRG